MAQVINTNVGALFAGSALNKSAIALQTAQQRLASGLRINTAKDDATGLAVATSYDTQIRGTNVAIRTANDGVSLAQTADGYLGQITENLQRISEVLVLAPAGNAETTALLAENTRINALVVNSSAVTVDGTGSQSTTLGVKPTLVNTASALGVGIPALVATAATAATANTAPALAAANDVTAINALQAAAILPGATVATVTAAVLAAAPTSSVYTAILVGPPASVSALQTLGTTAAAITAAAAVAPAAALAAANLAVANAQAAVGTALKADIATNLGVVGNARASFGAVMSTLASAVSTMQTASVNLSAAYSRIMDTDYASETTAMTRNNILQQAGTAVLAQANQTPNTVLTLLR